jgi:hypothetical protein
MFLFPIFLYLYIFGNFNSLTKINFLTGYDERVLYYPQNFVNESYTYEQISNFYEIQKKIDKLENNNISIEEKLKMISDKMNDDTPHAFSMLEGGLFNDWNFHL